jgi:hypothetical protein
MTTLCFGVGLLAFFVAVIVLFVWVMKRVDE